MDVQSGKNSNAKIIQYELLDNDSNYKLIELSQRHRQALIASCAYLRWMSRHAVLPDDLITNDQLDAWVSDLELRLMTDIDFCARMIVCINEDEDVRLALTNFMLEQFPSLKGNEVPQNVLEQNAYGSALGCDLDDGWGHIRDGLIERSFQRVIDVLEHIDSITDNQQMLANFLNATPGVGAFFDLIPVTDWILFFDNVRVWMKDQFIAGDTLTLRDEIACDLFCIWQENCSLSNAQIRDYYWSKTIELVPVWLSAFDSFSSLGNALGVLSQTNFGTDVVYALVGSQYGFLTFINDWFGVSIEITGNDLALGDPSDDWETLCNVCPTEYCDDMATGLGTKTFEASATHNLAVWNACVANSTGEIGGTWVEVSGEGGNGAIEGVLVCASDPTFGLQIRQATVIIDLGAEFDISEASMRYANVAVAGSNSTVIQLFDGTKTSVSVHGVNQSINSAWRTFAPVVSSTGVRYIAFSNVQSGTGGTPKIGQVCVTYDSI